MNKENNFQLVLNKRGYQADFSWLGDLRRILKRRFKINNNISLALVDADEIKKLNQIYRRQNKITDVLSFNLNSPDTLGEIIICLGQAKRQAKEKKVGLNKELQLLTVHGVLHLLGYNHKRGPTYAQKQEHQEKIILKSLN